MFHMLVLIYLLLIVFPIEKKINNQRNNHFVKRVRIRSYSGPYFPTFGLNTEKYSVPLRIQSECGKMRSRITPNTATFHAVHLIDISIICNSNDNARAADFFKAYLHEILFSNQSYVTGYYIQFSHSGHAVPK